MAIFYFRVRNEYTWVKADNKDQSAQWLVNQWKINNEDKMRYVTLEQLITEHIADGYSIAHRNDDYIIFQKQQNQFEPFICLLLLLLFVIPGIVYAVSASAPKNVRLQYPLR
jgi:hypothetical protein